MLDPEYQDFRSFYKHFYTYFDPSHLPSDVSLELSGAFFRSCSSGLLSSFYNSVQPTRKKRTCSPGHRLKDR